jgi:hypothetical protein
MAQDLFQSFRSGYDWSKGAVEDVVTKQEQEAALKAYAADDSTQQAPGTQAPASVTDTAAKAPEMPRGMGGLTAEQGKGVAPKPTAATPTGFTSQAPALTPPQSQSQKWEAVKKQQIIAGASPKTMDWIDGQIKNAQHQDLFNQSMYLSQRQEAIEDTSRKLMLAKDEGGLLNAFNSSPFSRDPAFSKQVAAFISDPNTSFADKQKKLNELGLSAKERNDTELKQAQLHLKFLQDQVAEYKAQEIARHNRQTEANTQAFHESEAAHWRAQTAEQKRRDDQAAEDRKFRDTQMAEGKIHSNLTAQDRNVDVDIDKRIELAQKDIGLKPKQLQERIRDLEAERVTRKAKNQTRHDMALEKLYGGKVEEEPTAKPAPSTSGVDLSNPLLK